MTAKPCHAPDIAAIEAESIENPWTEEDFLKELSQRDKRYLIAAADNAVIGFIGAAYAFDSADITNVAVMPKYRNFGAGERLLLAMKELIFGLNVREIFLEVRKSNNPAVCLYKKHGFEEISIRRGYYKNPAEDALVMRCAL